MLSAFFKAKPVVDESSQEWIFDTFAWCIDQLDGDFFKKSSELILPNNTFYPGSSTSVEEMAETIFSNTLKYTGMTEWPIKLVPADSFAPKQMPQLYFSSALRGENAKVSTQLSASDGTNNSASNSANISFKIDGENITPAVTPTITPTIDIAFHSSQLNQPQDLIAYLVQTKASILITQCATTSSAIDAPGGSEALQQTIDLVACFMGFGVIFSNTAYQFKGGCGSCNNRGLNRQAGLPELETVYALALFCVLKDIEVKQVKKELKSHLYKPFRQAHKDITAYLQQTSNPRHAKLIAPVHKE